MKIFGPQAANPLGYLERDWMNEPYIRGGYTHVMAPNSLRMAGNSQSDYDIFFLPC